MSSQRRRMLLSATSDGGAVAFSGPIRVDGRFWVTAAGTFRPLFQSGLALLARSRAARAAFLDQTRALGFNGLRVFAGALAWAPQTVEQARAALPDLLEDAAARGLYVYVVALTDSGTGYDAEAHLRAVAGICAAYPNCLLEVANEIGHETQSAQVNDIVWLRATARRVIPAGVVWSLGSVQDEPDPDGTARAAGGSFVTGHLDRGRDLYNQVRRVRELEALGGAARTPVMSGEPIGIAEIPMPGKQRFWGGDALAFSFAYGVLLRGFEVGGVFHSEQGLRGELLGPNTAAAARVCLAGWQVMDTGERLAFYNAGWAGSPVSSARFADKFPPNTVRAYSFVSGARGWTVLVGVNGDPDVQWANGWRPVRLVAEQFGTRIVEIGR